MSNLETIFTVDGRLGCIHLNRPQVLNALSPAQFVAIDRQLAAWARDEAVTAVVIEGAGERAFCAGGDIRAVWDARRRGDDAFNRAIFRDEYRMDRRIHHYPKPVVSILDGITMGGGAGLSVNGRYRVATERTLFAMPETAIGFFPDVGATHFLSRCPGQVGLYLGVTGARLGAADCLWAGLATHFVAAAQRDRLRAALAAAAASTDPNTAVPDTLAAFHGDAGPSPLSERAAAVDRCFDRATMREVISALVAEGSDWAWEALEPIGDNCPLSLALTFRQLRDGPTLSFDDAIRREYRMACRSLADDNIYEGIRALVIDKDRKPAWTPMSLAEVDPTRVAAYFSPLGEDELVFPG